MEPRRTGKTEKRNLIDMGLREPSWSFVVSESGKGADAKDFFWLLTDSISENQSLSRRFNEFHQVSTT
jgi:hypothetical protein